MKHFAMFAFLHGIINSPFPPSLLMHQNSVGANGFEKMMQRKIICTKKQNCNSVPRKMGSTLEKSITDVVVSITLGTFKVLPKKQTKPEF